MEKNEKQTFANTLSRRKESNHGHQVAIDYNELRDYMRMFTSYRQQNSHTTYSWTTTTSTQKSAAESIVHLK